MRNKNRATWTEACFREAVKNSTSLTEVIRAIGLLVKSPNYRTVNNYIALWNLDTSHFVTNWKKVSAIARKSIKIMTNEELFIQNSTSNPKHIKKRFITLVDNNCSICSINSWHGQNLALQMDHINGINTDNRLENLRLLCPNCHSLTDTFCGKNIKNKRKKKIHFCIDCNLEVIKGSTRCLPCYNIRKKNNKRAITWPSKTEILELIEIHGKEGAAKIIGCSDEGIRKHLKKLG